MKKLLVVLLIAFVFGGCSSEETFERIEDVQLLPVSSLNYQVTLMLPDGMTQETVSQDQETLYMCDDYVLTIRTERGGDMDRTVRQTTGYGKDDLSMIHTKRDGFDCWECAWTTAGELGLQICRTVILDDGQEHHVVSVMADASIGGELFDQWNHVLGSVTLTRTG